MQFHNVIVVADEFTTSDRPFALARRLATAGDLSVQVGNGDLDDGTRAGTPGWRAIPRCRQKVRFVPGGIEAAGVGRRRLVRLHVRRSPPALPLRRPGADVDTVIGRLMLQELDRHRPLWEVWMVDGLPDGSLGA
jgi:Wax ester synthase/diacylglycerol acyltransferase catalytic domain